MKTDTKKPDTASALDAAEKAKAKAGADLAEREQIFEAQQTAEAFEGIEKARRELELKTRLHGFALAAHEKCEADKLEAERAEAERIRLAELAKIAAEGDKLLVEAVAAAESIAKCWARSWDLRIRGQGLGGTGIDGFSAGLREAFANSLIAVGLNAGSIVVGY